MSPTLSSILPEVGASSTDAKSPIVPLRSEWIRTTEGLAAIRHDWQDLFSRSTVCNAFLTFGWMATWWKHWGAKSTLALLAVRNPGGELVGLAPLYMTRIRGLRRLGFLADEHVGSDHLAVLVRPDYEESVPQVIAGSLLACRDEWDFVEFQDAQDSPQLTRLTTLLRAQGMTTSRGDACICPFGHLPASVDAYLNSLSSGWRKDYNRQRRILERDSALEFVSLSSTQDLQRAFPDLIRLHKMRAQKKGRTSAFLSTGVPEFHAEALLALADGCWARLYLLRTNGNTIAVMYGFTVGNCFQYYQLGIDPAWQRSSLGKVVIGGAISHSIQNGCVEFDMLRGAESYKAFWVKETRKTITVRVFSRHLRGRLAHYGFQARAVAARLKSLIAGSILADAAAAE